MPLTDSVAVYSRSIAYTYLNILSLYCLIFVLCIIHRHVECFRQSQILIFKMLPDWTDKNK